MRGIQEDRISRSSSSSSSSSQSGGGVDGAGPLPSSSSAPPSSTVPPPQGPATTSSSSPIPSPNSPSTSSTSNNTGTLAAATPASTLSTPLATSSPLTSPSITASSSNNGGGGGGSSSSSSNSKTGVIAGAAVGAAVGAALLTFLITFMFFRRRSQRYSQRTASEKPYGKQPSGSDTAADPPPPHTEWMRHLPQPADDGAVQNAIKTLFTQIELHVENYYHDGRAGLPRELHEYLHAVSSPHLPAPLPDLLAHDGVPQTAIIKHCLAHLAVAGMSPETPPEQSFLPLDFTQLPQALARAGPAARSRIPVFAQSYAQWRVISAYLRPRPTEDQAYLVALDTAIANAVAMFGTAFGPWAAEAHSAAQREEHLTSTLRNAAAAGVLLFAQPCVFEFRWGDGAASGSSEGLVVLPALVKVADEHAALLEWAQVMVAPTRLGG